MTKRQEILDACLDLLASHPKGLRYSELMEKLKVKFPNYSPWNFKNIIIKLDSIAPDLILKPAKGLFVLKSAAEPQQTPAPAKEKLREQEFYGSFADYLTNDLQECTKAIPVGGSLAGEKWGTPDVIGIREPRRNDVIQLPIEVVSAEIKVNSASLITAFGQACSYKLFSHKSYIVVPDTSPKEDVERLDALCMIFGIGLILFDASNESTPKYSIRVRAIRDNPDPYYVNEYLRKKSVEKLLF
jgi:hypothetical protein